ncbi:MAG: NACHT domain-containing protein, partial [Phycisphaerae bacterium]|nr:NACHT domain-containing protein [Phycisphaerae bacterium]
MAILEILMKCLAEPLAKFLLKKYLGEPGSGIGGGLFAIAGSRLKRLEDQREAQRQFEGLADKIVKRIEPLFEQAASRRDVNTEAVARQLAQTLDGHIDAEFFVKHDLHPVKLEEALREACPLPSGHYSANETDLYDRALRETVRYVVELASNLPAFSERSAAQQLQRISHMSGTLDTTLETVQRIERALAPLDQGDEQARYEADYRQSVVRNLNYLELFGADIPADARRQMLSVAYITLSLETSARDKSKGELLPANRLFDRLTPDHSALLIRGEAGSGKTTLLRWASITAARLPSTGEAMLELTKRRLRASSGAELVEALRREFPEGSGSLDVDPRTEARRVWHWRIPFLIPLRSCSGGRLPKPGEFPDFISRELDEPPQGWVASVLKDERAIILIDGVDEVPKHYRESALKNQIRALVKAYPGNYFVITTRPAAVPEGWLDDLGFHEATINEMTDPDRRAFIDQWHEAVGQELRARGMDDGDLSKARDELKEALPENPPISRLAANPLLCAMVCALHRGRERKLPESQSELCEALCHMLLHRRERESGLDLSEFPECYRSLAYEQKRAIVQELACWMVDEGMSAMPIDPADEMIAKTLRTFPDHRNSSPLVVRENLVERSGMIRQASRETIDFIHNTFRDFLAAERFAQQRHVKKLADRALDPGWQPIILFAAGTRDPDFASELIRAVLSKRKTHGADNEMQYAILALRCRAAALRVGPDLDDELTPLAKKLLPPATIAAAEAVAEAGDEVVPLLRAGHHLNARQTVASIRALRLIGTPAAKRALEGFRGDRRQGVVRELSQAINPLLIGAHLELVREGQCLSEGVAALVTDLQPLAALNNLQSLDLSGTKVADLQPLA